MQLPSPFNSGISGAAQLIVCRKHKLVYLAPPKTGSSSIRQVLLAEPFNGDLLGGHAHHGFEWSERFAEYFFFITVRHPFTRMYSLWRMICNRRILFQEDPETYSKFRWMSERFPDEEPTIDEFMDSSDLLFRENWRCSWHLEQLPCGVNGTVVRLESYYKDLQEVPPLAACLDQVLHVNPRIDDGPPWFEVINANRAKKIRQLWAEDFIRFGYTTTLKATIALER